MADPTTPTRTLIGDAATSAGSVLSGKQTQVADSIRGWFEGMGLGAGAAELMMRTVALGATVLLAIIANYVARRILLALISKVIHRTKVTWDDALLRRKVFDRLSHLAPALVIFLMSGVVFAGDSALMDHLNTISKNAAEIYMVIVVLLVIDATLSALLDLYRGLEHKLGLPVRIIVQVAKLITFCLGGIVIFSLLINESPGLLLGGIGALTAVLLLVFKDPILGFVAGIQLSANEMVRLGDWIEMPKFGADGDVIEVSLTTVKVQNWDKTITTIPTYQLISDSFKNWRGMQESGGRRIKRSLNIDMTTIRFLSDDDIRHLKHFRHLRAYLEMKEKDIADWNAQYAEDPGDLINSRRLTNIGTLRAYIQYYLRAHPKIHQEMTFIVRQLAPTEGGLPIEIYVFTNDTSWVAYEGIQSDIFDHLIAMLPEFDLKVFQRPSGHDLRGLEARLGGGRPAEGAS